MSITVKSGATIAPTGGTDVVYTLISNANGNAVFENVAQADLRLRETLSIKVTRAKPDASRLGGYTQNRVFFFWKQPMAKASGEYTINTGRTEVAYDIETTPTAVQRLLDAMGLACTQSAISAIMKLAAVPA